MVNCVQFCFNFAFNFNLRRYTMVIANDDGTTSVVGTGFVPGDQARAYSRPLSAQPNPFWSVSRFLYGF
jgi:hypothetical protein